MSRNERTAHRNFAGLTTTLRISGNTHPNPSAQHEDCGGTQQHRTTGKPARGGRTCEPLLCMRTEAPTPYSYCKVLSSKAGRLALRASSEYSLQTSGRFSTQEPHQLCRLSYITRKSGPSVRGRRFQDVRGWVWLNAAKICLNTNGAPWK